MVGREPIEFWTRERCFITELLNDDAWPEVSLARCRVEPNVTTELHSLDVAEWYVIEQGEGRMQVGSEEPFDVGPGDTVAIAPHRPQQICNTGDTDLIFLCICAPRFNTDCYTARTHQEENNDVWSEPNNQ
jgi:mannose-6-phosphate isomerase-like protein (cupin superfamily)